MRLLAVLLVGLAVAAGGVWSAAAAGADPAPRAVVVLDRGADAESGRVSDAGNALRIWNALVGRGVDTRLLAAGVAANGETRVAPVAPTAAALAALDKDPVYAFRGATDARAALAAALELEGSGALDVVLIGPWSEVPAEKAKAYAGTLERWDERAPEAVRILSIGRGTGREVLAAARGWAGDGRVVVGYESPAVETDDYSPLPRGADPAPALEARVRVVCDVLAMGAQTSQADPGRAPAVLTLASDVAGDTLQAAVNAGVHTWRIRRQVGDGRRAVLTFDRADDARVHWLTAPPPALRVRWDGLRADARLAAPDGAPAAPFEALEAVAGRPVTAVYALQRTRSGRAPAWRVGVEDGTLPAGLEVEVGAEQPLGDEVGTSPVTVRFTARAAAPMEAEGVITLSADGMPAAVRLPFAIRVEAGRATWTVVPAPAALPAAARDARTRITLRAENGNVPASLFVRAACDGGQEGWLAAQVEAPDGRVQTWNLGTDLALPVGVEHALGFALAPDAPADLDWPCRVTLRLRPVAGVRIEAEPVEITVRKRRPRLVLEAPPQEHRLEGPTLLAPEPPVLTLDADGGDGAWLMALLRTEPVVRVRGDAPIGWQAVPRGAGTWHIVPAGRWTGAEPGVFEDEELAVEVAFEWAPGAVPEPATIPVRVPARWGRKGFLLLGLAGLALVLALTVLAWMRTPPVTGTLLYTVDGLAGTVGRLDLSPIKRRPQAITSGRSGRLSVAGAGDVVARVRPTRVGGMLEYADGEGVRERRLLVDGMSMRIGRHLLRYVSGHAAEVSDADAPQEVEDLLGPEFDLESGRIESLGDDDR